MTTFLQYVPALAHTKLHHPENNKRIANILPFLEERGILANLHKLDPISATRNQLLSIHNEGLVDYVRAVCKQGGGLLDQGDTYATSQSFNLASLAVGSCCAAVDEIVTGRATNGFALIRPPGHHAERDHVSGFCLFNNVAAAARHAQIKHQVERILILDFDVHHGNGTQDIFFEDDSVLFISMHLFAPFFYPGIGNIHEIGTRNGKGYTINVPFPPGVGDRGYLKILKEYIDPLVGRFKPEVILISVGFDAHWRDPLAMAGLSLRGYAKFSQALIHMAQKYCEGRILFILEGGYQLDVLNYGIANVYHALLGQDKIYDPFGSMPQKEREVEGLLGKLHSLDLPF